MRKEQADGLREPTRPDKWTDGSKLSNNIQTRFPSSFNIELLTFAAHLSPRRRQFTPYLDYPNPFIVQTSINKIHIIKLYVACGLYRMVINIIYNSTVWPHAGPFTARHILRIHLASASFFRTSLPPSRLPKSYPQSFQSLDISQIFWNGRWNIPLSFYGLWPSNHFRFDTKRISPLGIHTEFDINLPKRTTCVPYE